MPRPTLADQPITDPDGPSVLPHLTAAQVEGFALAAGKVVLDGGVGNMLERARANVRNVPVPTGRR